MLWIKIFHILQLMFPNDMCMVVDIQDEINVQCVETIRARRMVFNRIIEQEVNML